MHAPLATGEACKVSSGRAPATTQSSNAERRFSSLFHLAIAAFKIEILAEWALSKAIPTDWPSRPARLSSANGIICPLELLAALSGILTMGDALRGRSIHFFEDNTLVWSALIQGYSSSRAMARLSSLFHLAIAAPDIDLWVEWVPSKANPADWPSRPAHDKTPLGALHLTERPMIFPSPAEYAEPAALYQRLRNTTHTH